MENTALGIVLMAFILMLIMFTGFVIGAYRIEKIYRENIMKSVMKFDILISGNKKVLLETRFEKLAGEYESEKLTLNTKNKS